MVVSSDTSGVPCCDTERAELGSQHGDTSAPSAPSADSAQGVPHLPKASFSQHHQEVEIRKLHPIPAAVVVEFGNGISCLLIRSLGPGSDLGSLRTRRWGREEEKTLLRAAGRMGIKAKIPPQELLPSSESTLSFGSLFHGRDGDSTKKGTGEVSSPGTWHCSAAARCPCPCHPCVHARGTQQLARLPCTMSSSSKARQRGLNKLFVGKNWLLSPTLPEKKR